MKKIIFFVLNFLSLSLWAAQQEPSGIGMVANNMMSPVGVVGDFVNTACYLLGSSFLFAALIKYREHRRSPTMVPLSTVIFLLIAGGVLIALPIVTAH